MVARALQRCGVSLADGGTMAPTAAAQTGTARPSGSRSGFVARSPAALQVSDFQVVGAGPAIPLTFGCLRATP